MDEEDQIAADADLGLHDVPDSVLTYTPPKPLPDGFDDSQAYLHGQGSEDQSRLVEVQAAQDKLSKWISTFHGPESETTGNLRGQVDSGKISGHDYFAMTGRIYAGGTGDTAQRDDRGNITGYKSSAGPSATPGLDFFHKLNPDAPSNPGFSFLPEPSVKMPDSVAKAVPGADAVQKPGFAGLPESVGGSVANDQKFNSPYGKASVNFSGAMNRGPQLPASTMNKNFSNVA